MTKPKKITNSVRTPQTKLDLKEVDGVLTVVATEPPTGVNATLAERGARYGDFSVHANIAQSLQDVMREARGWARCSPDKRQALTVIADKIARVLSGDPEYKDNWHDIQGYAKLVEDRCLSG